MIEEKHFFYLFQYGYFFEDFFFVLKNLVSYLLFTVDGKYHSAGAPLVHFDLKQISVLSC